jgi:parvulin-like peptidyl-prolyl isomerase
MTKKGQTSGLPKAPPPDEGKAGKKQPRLIKEYKSRAERDAAVQRWILIGTGVVIGVAVLLLAVAMIGAAVAPTQTAATVNGENITVGELQTAVRLERGLRNVELNNVVAQYRALGATDDQLNQFLQSQPPFSTWLSEDSVPDQIGSTVLNQLIDARLIQAAVQSAGLSADSAAVEQRIQEFFGYDPAAVLATPTATTSPTASPTPLVSPTPSPSPTATLTPEFTPTASLTPVPSGTPSPTPNATEIASQFTENRDSFFGAIRSLTGLSDDQITAYFQRQALANALRDQVTAELARESQFLNTRVIEVDSEPKANEIVAALAAGESFSDLARANSQAESSVVGGQLDWQSVSQLSATFGADAKTALEAAAVGGVVGPIVTPNGTWVVLQVQGSEQRTMTDEEYEQAKSAAFAEYLTSLRDAATITLSDAWIGRVPMDPRLAIRN